MQILLLICAVLLSACGEDPEAKPVPIAEEESDPGNCEMRYHAEASGAGTNTVEYFEGKKKTERLGDGGKLDLTVEVPYGEFGEIKATCTAPGESVCTVGVSVVFRDRRDEDSSESYLLVNGVIYYTPDASARASVMCSEYAY